MADIRLWVDDLRPPPDESWRWVKTSGEAIGALHDHDLGEDDTTRPIVRWMAEYSCWPSVVRVHTANPVGRQYLEGMIEHYGPGVTR